MVVIDDSLPDICMRSHVCNTPKWKASFAEAHLNKLPLLSDFQSQAVLGHITLGLDLGFLEVDLPFLLKLINLISLKTIAISLGSTPICW
jgi:hypothetical protein